MARYSVTVNATSETIVNTEDIFVELALSTVSYKVKRVRVRLGDGTATAGVDNDYRVRLLSMQTAGSGGTTATEVARHTGGDAADVVATVKNGTTDFDLGTENNTFDQVVKNGRETYEWIAFDENDTIILHPTTASGNIFAVVIQSAVVSQKFQVTVEWEE